MNASCRSQRYSHPLLRRLQLILAVSFVCFVGRVQAESGRVYDQVRLVLAEHCLHCHGPDPNQRQADLRLDTQVGSHQVVVPGEPDQSELIIRVTSEDPDLRMPPPDSGESLSPDEISLLNRWITDGAEYRRHWAFEGIVKPAVPPTRQSVATDIDRFIVAELESRGMMLAQPVSRQRLIRRATFDLTGLPPTWQEVEAFVNDPAPDAFVKVVDRLLDSSRYGERWGRHWLDIARYADTHGGSAIGFTKFPFSYAYRDYVIRSFNADVPYDQFVMQQVAADQMKLGEENAALAGLGFLTVGMQFRNPHDTVDDQIDVVTRGLMGLTVACARCHDHKYDAISAADYYSLYATLASSSQPDELPLLGQPPQNEAYRKYQEDREQNQIIHQDMARDQTAAMRSRLRMQVGLYLRELAKGTPEQDLSAVFLSYRTDDLRPLVLNRWREYLQGMPEDDPVFGLWVQLSNVSSEDFEKRCSELLEAFKSENGDPKAFEKEHQLGTAAPKWNPRVLEAIASGGPKSMLELSDAYGKLFAKVHQEWLQALLDASLEAGVNAQILPDQDERHATLNSAINQQLRRHLYADGTPTALSDDLSTKLLNRTVRDNLSGKKGAIHGLDLNSPGSPPRAMVLRETSDAGPFYVFRRGNPIDRGEPVHARFLTALAGSDPGAFPVGTRRLGLARAIVDPDNPLTRRVIVNWVWRHHFGLALVRTPDDFGTRGDPPTHPELLDYLAATLLEDGWSIKQLHRRIMMSDVYRQSAIENPDYRIQDPDNRLFWRMPRRRLEMESMRDAMLVVSGELQNEPMGGRPFDFLSRPVVPRRSVYGFVNRDIVSSLASTFDGANPTSCTAKRPQTTVPQQTLFALNSDFIQDRAAALARLSEGQRDDEARVQWLYQRCFSRSADSDEMETALRFVRGVENAQDVEGETATRWQALTHVLLAANEFVFVD